MPRYSIAICNYNMGETVGDALDSILEQVDERFEVLVVDDGSTDQSVNVLREKEASESALRVLELPPSDTRKLGVTRNISVHAADGEFVLLHLDADDVFADGIIDVVDVFERVNEGVPRDFYFMSCGFGIGKREFLINHGPYRNLPVGGEDQDLWRRLFNEDAIIWVKSENLSTESGYEKSRAAIAKRWFRVAVSNFQTGITCRSYLSWSRENRSTFGFLYDLFLCAPLAYLVAWQRPSYDLPEGFRKRGVVDERIREETSSIPELEAEYEFDIGRDSLSDRAKELFHLD